MVTMTTKRKINFEIKLLIWALIIIPFSSLADEEQKPTRNPLLGICESHAKHLSQYTKMSGADGLILTTDHIYVMELIHKMEMENYGEINSLQDCADIGHKESVFFRTQYVLYRHYISDDAPEKISNKQYNWARNILEKLAKKGNTYAQFALGTHYSGYLRGFKIPGNWPEEALKWLKMIPNKSSLYPETYELILKNEKRNSFLKSSKKWK